MHTRKILLAIGLLIATLNIHGQSGSFLTNNSRLNFTKTSKFTGDTLGIWNKLLWGTITYTPPPTQGVGYLLQTDGFGVTSWVAPGSMGLGTVTNFSAGTLSPLFTTNVANPTTTPALTFTLSNAGANTWFGNNTGSSAAPAYNSAGTVTKVDDTNVTLTLGGTPTNAVLNAFSITAGWTGLLAVSRGGTGVGTLTGVVQASGTSPFTASYGTSYQVYRMNSGGTAAEWDSEIQDDGDNFRVGQSTLYPVGGLYNTVVGAGSKSNGNHNTFVGNDINSANAASSQNIILGGNGGIALNAADQISIMPTVSHLRIGGMIGIGNYITLPTSGTFSNQPSNGPIYIGNDINNSETAPTNKSVIFIGQNISTAGFTSSATTHTIVISQDPTLEDGLQQSVGLGYSIGLLDGQANCTVLGPYAEAFQDPVYGVSGGGIVAIGDHADGGAWRAVAVGGYSTALGVSTTAIGYASYANQPHGSAYGRGAYNPYTNSALIYSDASTGATNVGKLIVGAAGAKWHNPAVPGGGETVDLSTELLAGTVISRITVATGQDLSAVPSLTDIRGAHLRLLGGVSTGTAAGGDVQFAVTPAGGVSNNTLNTEYVAGAFKASDKAFYIYDPVDADNTETILLVQDQVTGETEGRTVASIIAAAGTVTSVSATDGNGFDFTVTNPTTTPAISLTTTLTSTRIVVAGSSGALTDDAGYTIDFSNDHVTMASNWFALGGTNTENYNFHVQENARVEGVFTSYSANKTILAIRRANGTLGSETPILNTEVIGDLSWGGYKTTAWSTSSVAAWQAVATEDFDDSGTGTKLVGQVTPNNTTGVIDALVLQQDGTTSAVLGLTAGHATAASAEFQVGTDGDLDKIKNIAYSWPTDDGDAGEVLTTDGSGNLTWEPAGGGSQTPWTSNINADGFTLFGNDGSGESLTLTSTSHATKGFTYLGGSGVFALDETNERVGINEATPDARLHLVTDGIGVTQSNANGIYLQNTTAASSGNQQTSPGVVFEGQGWKTTAAAASQPVAFRLDVLPVQGSSNPTANFQIQSSINGGAYAACMTITSGGQVTISASLGVSTNFGVGGQMKATGTTSTTPLTYRTTNGGSNVTPDAAFTFGYNGSTAGNLGYSFDGTNAFTFTAANGTRHIARAGMTLTNLDNTAGSEDGDLAILTQAAGAAMAIRFVVTNTGNIYGTALHNNGTSPTGTTNQYIASGTYTPGLTNVTNVAASTAYQCQWTRVGNVVTVSGKVDIDATAAAATELGIALPLASNLAAEQNLGGAGSSAAAASLSAAIRADAANDRAAVVFTATSLTNDSYFFTFTYLML